MIVAVASGKGGTGKTLVAVNFARLICYFRGFCHIFRGKKKKHQKRHRSQPKMTSWGIPCRSVMLLDPRNLCPSFFIVNFIIRKTKSAESNTGIKIEEVWIIWRTIYKCTENESSLVLLACEKYFKDEKYREIIMKISCIWTAKLCSWKEWR